MLACTKENVAVVETLVKSGASLDLVNKDGWTPFHIACRYCVSYYNSTEGSACCIYLQ